MDRGWAEGTDLTMKEAFDHVDALLELLGCGVVGRIHVVLCILLAIAATRRGQNHRELKGVLGTYI